MNSLYRLGYRIAYRAIRLWWLLRRPEAQGAAVAVWQDGGLLLVRSSYRRRLDLPGGGIVKVPQQPLIDVQAWMSKQPGA